MEGVKFSFERVTTALTWCAQVRGKTFIGREYQRGILVEFVAIRTVFHGGWTSSRGGTPHYQHKGGKRPRPKILHECSAAIGEHAHMFLKRAAVENYPPRCVCRGTCRNKEVLGRRSM